MAEALPGLTGYVLAGGRSSRMGQDKAAMRLGDATLLEVAVRKLRRVCGEVVVIGSGPDGGADRVVADRHLGCGPMGGIEAALGDVRGEWAMFLPVDMPLLPAGLVEALGSAWSMAVASGVRATMAVADGVPQPLVSLLHRGALATVEAAIAQGQYKVRPVLEEVAGLVAAAQGVPLPEATYRTEIRIELGAAGNDSCGPGVVRVGDQTVWQPSAAEWRFRHLWFSNLNTPEEFAGAQQVAVAAGAA